MSHITIPFTPKTGMSYVLTKRACECTPEERQYKLEYGGRWVKERFIARHGRDAYHRNSTEYAKEYYAKHREDLIARAKENKRRQREANGETLHPRRGRPRNTALQSPPEKRN